MRLTLWRDDARLSRPVVAATERHDVRPRLFLEFEDDGVSGVGEIGAQPASLNGDPSVEEVVAELTTFLLPQVVAMAEREGEVPDWTRAVRWRGPRAASRAGVALLEMALLDRALRAEGSTLADLWPARFAVSELATVSLLEEGEWSVGADVTRVRAKTRPGAIPASLLERLGGLGREVLLDFNASATSPEEVVEQVSRVSRVATLVAVEQPFAPGNVADHAALASRLGVPVSLDEGVRTAGDLDQVARYGAATVVCLKPARVGGLATARSLASRARDLGLRPYVGGFFESGFARAVTRTLCANAVSEPSDVAVVARGDFAAPEAVPSAAGVGVAPSGALRERLRLVVTLR